jgi:ABC-type nitrate/sulfonate/bicarbonate transport system substrate-binding protein
VSGPMRFGFVPLTDAAGLIAAHARGFFVDEGLEVELVRESSWATMRDKLAVGALDGAHMLAPLAMAQSLGVGSETTDLIVPLALASDSAAITVSSRLGLGATPSAGALADLVEKRRRISASPLTFSVVFPYSTHNYLLRGWMARVGLDPDRDVRLTVAPPPRMARLLAEGVIEGFCAGEPWNAVAIEAGVGVVAARAAEILPLAPDKVFATPRAWAAADPARLQAVLRALLRGLAWAEAPENRRTLASLLAQPQFVGTPAEAILAGLRHIAFHRASRPEPAHAAWLVEQMLRWGQIDSAPTGAEGLYRPDLYDQAAGAA